MSIVYLLAATTLILSLEQVSVKHTTTNPTMISTCHFTSWYLTRCIPTATTSSTLTCVNLSDWNSPSYLFDSKRNMEGHRTAPTKGGHLLHNCYLNNRVGGSTRVL